MNLAPVLLGIDLMVAVRAYKKVARIAGNLGDSIGGAVGTLIVLLGPVIVLGTGTFVHNAVSRSGHALFGMQQLVSLTTLHCILLYPTGAPLPWIRPGTRRQRD